MNAPTRIFVPGDTSACSVRANEVASAIAAHCALQDIPVTVVRTGSRGAAWLEPLIEVDAPNGRYGFANVQPEDIPGLFAGGVPSPDHERCIGIVADHPWFAQQHRLTFRRAGIIDPLSLSDYRALGGLVGLTRALSLSRELIVHDVTSSGLRGRGGAAFPAGIKWNTVRQAPGATKYVVCNADEGDSGTFADRLLIESDPFQLIEGMIIAGLAVGASRGIVYLRSEYPLAIRTFERALDVAYEAGLLGPSVLDSAHHFDIALRTGAGAYICGEETALLESLEGKRGVVRAKPPLPALSGLFGCPTVINNVLTLAAVSDVVAMTGREYAALGHGRSTGTMPFQLGGNVARGGLVEFPFGVSLRTLLDDVGGGTLSGRPMHAVQVGGPLGAYLPRTQWDTPLTYEHLAELGAMLGHGGIVVFDDTVDMAEQAQFAMEFCAHESCGKCTPCRIGSTRGVEVITRLRRGESPRAQWELLEELCETMELGSLCAMGGLTPMPVRSVMKHFPSALLSSPSRTSTGAEG
ncbi:formate dehydrogenase beta subunit [Gemmatimonas phototrophica]|uniref:Formate dehydrogenase n=1 Tax=Gemmatimonas phototrophica TaxID=1379270 RepID=A0A143BLK3_9BACT|nr:formate dehydrogenase beta subunit [Gemmatimonas phototrophica]AMW05334.1 formate dehydrogenase [Gemmatimonas phototrophica]